MIADTSAGGACRVFCNGCGALAAPVPGRSWATARRAAAEERMPPLAAGWTVGKGLSTTDLCPRCTLTPATAPLVEDPCPSTWTPTSPPPVTLTSLAS